MNSRQKVNRANKEHYGWTIIFESRNQMLMLTEEAEEAEKGLRKSAVHVWKSTLLQESQKGKWQVVDTRLGNGEQLQVKCRETCPIGTQSFLAIFGSGHNCV